MPEVIREGKIGGGCPEIRKREAEKQASRGDCRAASFIGEDFWGVHKLLHDGLETPRKLMAL
jgi:hypothetical protein